MEATIPSIGSVATLSALKISRRFCRGSFLEIMDAESDELHQFSVKLFDKFGRARGKGLGTAILNELVSSEHVETGDTLICWPAPVGVDKLEWSDVKAKQVRFFRKVRPIFFLRKGKNSDHLIQNGFRRIGRTQFFGYSTVPTHPSRAISITEDVGEHSDDFNTSSVANLSPDEMAEKYPLHSAIINTSGQAVLNAIQSHYRSDPSSIHQPDAFGLTPIHVALSKPNPDAVKLLLDLGVNDDLRNAHNAEGTTPLEALADSMRSTREFSETLLGKWDGHDDAALTCEFLTKRAMGIPTICDDIGAYIAKSKWGCTCGVCADGWLTKRMRFRLSCQAALAKDMMEDDMRTFQRGVPLSASDFLLSSTDYIPPPLRNSILKTFYVGYQSIFDTIYNFLEQTQQPLSKMSILLRCQGAAGVSFYFGKGGQIEHAFDAITHISEEQSSLGDGTFEELWEEEGHEQYIGLPCSVGPLL
ncbi:hypothetical protein H0H93_016876 [Arthromyces matolae]|nr:hypothetical protein H0H93_016876 [Arthromyces matolae]